MAGRILFRVAHPCSLYLHASVPALICPGLPFQGRPTAPWSRQVVGSSSRFVSSSTVNEARPQNDPGVLGDAEGDRGSDAEVSDMEPSERYSPGSAFVEQPDKLPHSIPTIERPRLPGSIKKLNRLLGRQQLGEIPEHELKEQFVRGSGPGGQAINKTSSSVSLIHLPTGVRVQAQPTRSREANRKAARRILAAKLDLMVATGSWSRDGGVKATPLEADLPADDGLASSLAKEDEESEGTDPVLGKKSRKETRKKEEVEMAEKWSRQEILWEKERRRKANRAKKSKKKRKDGEAEGGDEVGDAVQV